jgi:hypothetical protein
MYKLVFLLYILEKISPVLLRVPIKCETKRNQRKWNETKQNQQKRNETKSTKWKRNQRNENEIKRNQWKQNEINEIDWYEENGRKKIKDKTK